MNQLFMIFCAISMIIAIVLVLSRKIGFWGALTIVFALPVCLLIIAIVILIIGGDK